jgi:hypothetical protein
MTRPHLFAMLAALLAAGCSFAPGLVLENSSGQMITLHGLDRNRVDVHPRQFRLASGQSRLFLTYEATPDDTIRITTAACEHRYARPPTPLEMIDNHKAWLRLRVRPDMSLWYAPLDVRNADEATLAARQPEGFPLRPTTTCGPDAEAATTR